MKAKEYRLMEEAVDCGVDYGYMKAHKHDEFPTEEAIKREIISAIMDTIDERFKFDPDDF